MKKGNIFGFGRTISDRTLDLEKLGWIFTIFVTLMKTIV